jgi:hypothetical protein
MHATVALIPLFICLYVSCIRFNWLGFSKTVPIQSQLNWFRLTNLLKVLDGFLMQSNYFSIFHLTGHQSLHVPLRILTLFCWRKMATLCYWCSKWTHLVLGPGWLCSGLMILRSVLCHGCWICCIFPVILCLFDVPVHLALVAVYWIITSFLCR